MQVSDPESGKVLSLRGFGAGADRDGDSADDATYRVGGGDGLSASSAGRDPATKTKVER